MPQYLSPGVYVEEVPSAIKAIAGVSTSTPGFTGIVPDSITVPVSSSLVRDEKIGQGDGTITEFNLRRYPVQTTAGAFEIRVNGAPTSATLSNDDTKDVSKVTFDPAPAADAVITGDLVYEYTCWELRVERASANRARTALLRPRPERRAHPRTECSPRTAEGVLKEGPVPGPAQGTHTRSEQARYRHDRRESCNAVRSHLRSPGVGAATAENLQTNRAAFAQEICDTRAKFRAERRCRSISILLLAALLGAPSARRGFRESQIEQFDRLTFAQ